MTDEIITQRTIERLGRHELADFQAKVESTFRAGNRCIFFVPKRYLDAVRQVADRSDKLTVLKDGSVRFRGSNGPRWVEER